VNEGIDYGICADRRNAVPGQVLTYTISIQNLGEETVDVSYNVALPEQLEHVSGDLSWSGDAPSGRLLQHSVVVRLTGESASGAGGGEWVVALFEDGAGDWERRAGVPGPARIYLPVARHGPVGGP
jgi:uncharacterized repeat protein (TIGR01451 family)